MNVALMIAALKYSALLKAIAAAALTKCSTCNRCTCNCCTHEWMERVAKYAKNGCWSLARSLRYLRVMLLSV
jgi:hypothetical protein